MSTVPHRVVLTGRTLRGKSEHAVAEGLGPVLGQDPAIAAGLLGHGEVTVHSELSWEAAQHFVAALQAIGADARCEPTTAEATPSGPALPELEPLRVANAAATTFTPRAREAAISAPGIAGWWVAAALAVIFAGKVSTGAGLIVVLLGIAVASVATRTREDRVTTALAALTGLIVLLLVLLFTRALSAR